MERMQRGDSNPWTQRVSGNVPDGNGEGHCGKVYGASNEPWGKQHLTQEKRTSQPVQCLLFPHAPCTPLPSSLTPGAVPTCQLCSAEISAFPMSCASNDVPTYSCRDQLLTQHWLQLSPFPGGFSDPSTESHYSIPAGCPCPPLLHWDYPEFCLCGSLV